MTDTIRAGVIGFGLAGRIFHAAVIHATPGLELAAIVQRTGDEAAKAYPQVKICRSIEELLADESIRLIAVGTPSSSHFEVAEQCLRADRDVVIDKPFALTSDDAAQLIRLARERKRLLTAYQNRRWDGDFKTVEKMLVSGLLGRLVTFESHFDRFRPEPRLRGWRENGGPGGGTLFDLGSHLIDQALTLFGNPEKIFASVRIDRDNGVVDDVFDITLFYKRLTAYLRASTLTKAPGARFTLHGTQGSFVKFGLDPQEDQLKGGILFDAPGFGQEPEEAWGKLYMEGAAPERVETEVGDYRGIYANVRDALLGKAKLVVAPEQAWRTTRLIELARESSSEGRVLPVDLSNKP
ncbi:Gfo/Idh/MocA family oxidoreductase [Alloacidobacterium dinghuense]|uniref:Gfo/Idh/MocA family oxidoreductase n=1 Tax=Alloacidobacterium dinghuense TaxID=2763107 RepID=A0A7G8BKF3_9BACT|nr:Gfo/Idh/MocA family oxidoreductase [Alloacidobacterium dinghuense]QNI33023.1 Gfo/Idh/MocA family oxidoreductase [Alloacidobacterium dinghuense]